MLLCCPVKVKESYMRSSLIQKLIHLFGSVKLALIILAILATTCAIATFTEFSFNAKFAQATIYRAPWFICCLLLLCVNLFAATLTRWPWKRKHVGFITTHFGIIMLLVGALVGATFGIEGNIILRIDVPTDQVITNRNVIQVESSAEHHIYWTAFDAEISPPSPNRPRRFSIPGTPLAIVAHNSSTALRSEPELLAVSGASPAILLELSSSMVPIPIRIPLFLHSSASQKFNFFHLANICFLPQLPKRTPRIISEPYMVFSHHPTVHAPSSENTGWKAMLNPNGSLLTLIGPINQSKILKISELLGHAVQIDDATICAEAFWPDFKMRNGKPTTSSYLPRNPAVLLRISAPSHNASCLPLLEIAPNTGNQYALHYQLSRNDLVYASGNLISGSSFHTGWADWKAKLLACLPSASLTSRLVPSLTGQGFTGFQAFLKSRDGTNGPSAWVGPGIVTTLLHRDGWVRVTYGLEVLHLPFNVRLSSFTVPRYEGTDMPSNYISLLDFYDNRTGASKQGVARMNHPASFPGGWWRTVTGWNYKFSQAQWNPTDLQETTLQVLYDPGWLLKWSGACAICLGILIMFCFNYERS